MSKVCGQKDVSLVARLTQRQRDRVRKPTPIPQMKGDNTCSLLKYVQATHKLAREAISSFWMPLHITSLTPFGSKKSQICASWLEIMNGSKKLSIYGVNVIHKWYENALFLYGLMCSKTSKVRSFVLKRHFKINHDEKWINIEWTLVNVLQRFTFRLHLSCLLDTFSIMTNGVYILFWTFSSWWIIPVERS